MNKVLGRIRTAIARTLAKADTWLAVVGLWLAGINTANERWVLVAIFGFVGLTFLVASGDYSWRKGFAEGRRD